MKITKNVGNVDRAVRLVIAVIFSLLAYFWATGVAQIVLYVLAIAMVATAAFRFCGLYAIFNINTYSNDKRPALETK